LENKCIGCGLTEWMNKPIALQLDHIDGNKKNNAKENLRILCPNCHSQTHTYAGKRNTEYRTVEKYSACKKCGKKILLNSKLCLNCNGFSKRKVNHPSKEELEKMIWEKSTVKIAKDYGVSDNAVAKWCKNYGISKPPRGYWMKNKQHI
jgi:ribosomal protein L44E